MLREVRRLDAPELHAFHEAVEVRTPYLRVGVHRGQGVASDFGVLERAMPFVHRMSRPCLTLLLEGHGRFDEGGRRLRIEPGDLAVSDQRRGGTEAYAGAFSRWIVMDWDPCIVGAPHAGALDLLRLSPLDRARLGAAAREIGSPRSAEASAEIVRVLRSVGLGFERIAPRALDQAPPLAEQELARVFGAQLSNLRAHPAFEDVVSELGWNKRLVHRRLAAIADRYALPWEHWRSALHHQRLASALRLLSAPGATTELVSELTGFRAPSALCHAFAKAGLPSPGTFAQSARKNVIEAWAEHAAPSVRAA